MLYEIRVQLRYIKPPIWRLLRVPSNTSLLKLHKVLQTAMGWKNSHLHLFRIDGKLYGEPDPEWDIDINDYRRIRLQTLFSANISSFIYEYDMGDGWLHDIDLLRVVLGKLEK